MVLRSAVLPSALPSILTGVRVGLGFAWRALIAAEILGSPVGLGQMIYQAAAWQRTDIMIAGALVIGLLGTLFDRLVLETSNAAPWCAGAWSPHSTTGAPARCGGVNLPESCAGSFWWRS